MISDENRCFFIVISSVCFLFFLFIFIFSFGKINFNGNGDNSIILYIFLLGSFLLTIISFIFLIIVSKLDEKCRDRYMRNKDFEKVEQV